MLQTYHEITEPLSLVWNHKLFTLGGVKLSLGNLTLALTLLLFATRLSRRVAKFIDRKLIQKFVPDQGIQMTYQTFVFYVCLLINVTIALGIAGIPLTVFTVFGGALAIGVGFGSQNIVNNFISGVIIMAERPIRVGDIVQLDAITGTVIAIGTRSTHIRNGEGKIFVVPNSFFLEKSVLNWTYENSRLKDQVNFGVDYNSDVKLVESLTLQLLKDEPGILQDPAPFVLFDNINLNSLDFQAHFYCSLKYEKSSAQIKSSLRFKLKEKFKEHHIDMAHPQRDMNLKVSDALEVKILT